MVGDAPKKAQSWPAPVMSATQAAATPSWRTIQRQRETAATAQAAQAAQAAQGTAARQHLLLQRPTTSLRRVLLSNFAQNYASGCRSGASSRRGRGCYPALPPFSWKKALLLWIRVLPEFRASCNKASQHVIQQQCVHVPFSDSCFFTAGAGRPRGRLWREPPTPWEPLPGGVAVDDVCESPAAVVLRGPPRWE